MLRGNCIMCSGKPANDHDTPGMICILFYDGILYKLILYYIASILISEDRCAPRFLKIVRSHYPKFKSFSFHHKTRIPMDI